MILIKVEDLGYIVYVYRQVWGGRKNAGKDSPKVFYPKTI